MPLPAQTTTVGGKISETRSILSLRPTREDDEAKFRCVVLNRAMAEGQRLETNAILSVNCKLLQYFTIHVLFIYMTIKVLKYIYLRF